MIDLNNKGYTIKLGNDDVLIELNQFVGDRYADNNVFILCDSNTTEHCLPKIDWLDLEHLKDAEVLEVEPGEGSKSIEIYYQLIESLLELGANRKSVLINLGGGIVSDLGGFVASTFKRGIDFINVPTTLLAMVDASIGGKNGVDLGNLKNQIGIIKEPKAVIIDTHFLSTLSAREMRSGLAEMLKHGLIYDKKYWDKFKNLTDLNTDDLNSLIYESIQIKNTIVSQDLTENGIRKSLNFGHTLGHAIESYLLENPDKESLLHGEAIAIGMILESYISKEKNLISENEYLEIKDLINSIYKKVNFNNVDIQKVIDLLIFDKKNEFGTIQFALLDGIGKIKINQTAENELIMKSFENYKN